ncbi:MAG TPA: TetR/AcrR family transcriptional regulator [Conexibacter sp.]|nr:TetR/AcrR family transcriptional regulator [Conexibacter sp.]
MRRAEVNLEGLVTAFAPDGIHGVGIVELARAAGVAKPTLYRAHGSKDALFFACVEAEVEQLLERLYAAWAKTLDLALADALAALARALLAHADERPDAFRLLLVTAEHRGSTIADDVAGTIDRIVDRLAELLARHPAWHADPADAELVAALLPAAAVAAVRRTAVPWDRDAMAARIAAVLRPLTFAG